VDETQNIEEPTADPTQELNLEVETPKPEPSTEDQNTADADEEVSDRVDSEDGTEDMQERYRPYGDRNLGSQQISNMLQMGTIVLHYPHRDVHVPLDGDAALRLLTMFRARTDRHWQDDLNPHRSSAKSGWLVLDLNEVLCVSWTPSAGSGVRTAIDPQ
jgi:hypothetical protein